MHSLILRDAAKRPLLRMRDLRLIGLPSYFFTSGHSLSLSGLAASSGEIVATSL
jgi:hypothetical protein